MFAPAAGPARKGGPTSGAGRRIAAAALLLLLLVSLQGCAALSGSGRAPGREEVFLLHGLGGSARSMRKLQDELSGQGYVVHNLDFSPYRESIEQLANRLASAVDTESVAGERIHFVAHSLGGLVVRSYLGRDVHARVGRVVMLAPPNGGSELADILKHVPWLRDLAGPAGGELGTRSAMSQPWPARYELGIIAGTKSFDPLSRWVIPGKDDGVVSVDSARLAGMKDFITVNRSHSFIMNAPEVIEQTAWFLEHGMFRHDSAPADGSLPSSGAAVPAAAPPPGAEP